MELIEIELAKPDDFLKIKETLTRVGIKSRDGKTLTQSCHILHKNGRYYIVHFKQMFMLDGRKVDFTVEDAGRLSRIVKLLAKWNLLSIADSSSGLLLDVPGPGTSVTVIPYSEKENWNLVSKYTIGEKRG